MIFDVGFKVNRPVNVLVDVHIKESVLAVKRTYRTSKVLRVILIRGFP